MDVIEIPIQKLTAELPTPKYAYVGDAGVDLHSACEKTLQPFERAVIPCGVAIALPEGYAGLVIPRSGLAAKHGISIVNSPGLIDSNYRGEIKVILVNLDPHNSFQIHLGDRIAQLMVIRIDPIAFMESDCLPESNRGAKGFGSSGFAANPPS